MTGPWLPVTRPRTATESRSTDKDPPAAGVPVNPGPARTPRLGGSRAGAAGRGGRQRPGRPGPGASHTGCGAAAGTVTGPVTPAARRRRGDSACHSEPLSARAADWQAARGQ